MTRSVSEIVPGGDVPRTIVRMEYAVLQEVQQVYVALKTPRFVLVKIVIFYAALLHPQNDAERIVVRPTATVAKRKSAVRTKTLVVTNSVVLIKLLAVSMETRKNAAAKLQWLVVMGTDVLNLVNPSLTPLNAN